MAHGAEWLAIKRCRLDWFGVSTLERDRCKGAFFAFKGIFMCVSLNRQSCCRKWKNLWSIPLQRENRHPSWPAFPTSTLPFISLNLPIRIANFISSLHYLDSSLHYFPTIFSPKAWLLGRSGTHAALPHATSLPEQWQCSPPNHRRLPLGQRLSGSANRGQSFLSNWRAPRRTPFQIFIHHVRLQWCGVSLMEFLKIGSVQ